MPYHDGLDHDAALGWIAAAIHQSDTRKAAGVPVTDSNAQAMTIYKAAQARHGISDAEITEYIRTHTTA